MPTRLIVNADDFGLTPGINRAIAELHAAGAVSSATLMARGPAFDDAVQLAAAHPTLGVGCHVVLTDGLPVSDPEDIPTLLGPDGKHLRPQLKAFILALLLGRIDAAELVREIVAQIELLQRAGIHVTHLDTHKHTHVFPSVARALLQAAQRTGVHAVRAPFEQRWSLRLGQTRLMRWLTVAGTRLFRRAFMNMPQIRSGAVLTTAGTLGISTTGRLNRKTLSELLKNLPEGTWELICHPGYNDSDLGTVTTRLRSEREIEQQALYEAFSRNSPHPPSIELIHYGRLGELTGKSTAPLTRSTTATENLGSEPPR